RWPTDKTSGDSSWYLTGVQCERCHVAEASYKTPGGNVEIAEHEGFGTGNTSQAMTSPPVDLRATALCMECHRQETVSTAGSGTITPTYPPVAVDAGYCSDLTSKSYSTCTAGWVYVPTMSHAQGSQFLNSPHAEFTGTVTQNAQNSPDLSVVINGTFNAIIPTPEGGYFMETSGTDDAQNKGCTACHDPHQTTVVTPAQYAANPALLHSLQGNTVPATNCNNAVCHSTIGTNLLSSVKHPVGPGTPFPNGGTDADIPGACVTCHMQAASPNPANPTQGVAQSHFFRISVDPNYYTFPTAAQYYSGTTALNVATDTVTGFTAAIWNDVDVACGQCHGGGTAGQNPYGIAPPNPAPPAFTRTYLASAAAGMHASDGLFTTAATPTFLPVAGTYATAQTVTIASTTPGATICYTTDGIPATAAVAGTCDTTDVTEKTLVNGGTVSVASSETLNAIATIASGFSNSASGTAAYIINTAVVPTYLPVAGSYATAQTVKISSTTAAATICYTTNGTIPTATVPGTCDANVGELGLANGATVSVTASETINSIATLTGGANSGNVAAAYVIPVAVATPTAAPAAGSYTSTQTVTLTSTGNTICYTTNGSVPTAATPGTCDSNGGVELSFASGGHVTVSASETVEAIATKVGSTNSATLSAAYTIAPTAVATPAMTPVAGSYVGKQTVVISSTTTGATICYTTNGSTPTAAVAGTCDAIAGESTLANGGSVTVGVTEQVAAIATLAGDTNSASKTAAYTITAATPTFAPVAGSYVGTQTVTISSTTTGAAICYTTDGSTPQDWPPGTCQ